MSEAEELFSAEEIERGRRYRRPLCVARLADGAIALTVLVLLSFPPVRDVIADAAAPLPWPAETAVFVVVSLLALTVAGLPLAFWSGYVRERRFGLSTQTAAGWFADRAKGIAIAAVLVTAAMVGLAALVRLAPGGWPLLAAVGAAVLVVVLGFVAPVVLEPVFNRFRPLSDAELAARLRSLAERSGQPVREVLVADASRRTRKLNAYVSGLGATRRVVVFDTLLERAQPREVAVVVAHELAHRRERHVEKLTALAAAGAALAVAAVWIVLGDAAGSARYVPVVLLLFGLAELAGAPVAAAVSRRYERAADTVALKLTRDPAAFEAVFRTLAAANLADLAPPRLLHALFSTHPTIPERIARARRFATVAA